MNKMTEVTNLEFEFQCARCYRPLTSNEIHSFGHPDYGCKMWCSFCFIIIDKWRLKKYLEKELKDKEERINNRILSKQRRKQTIIKKRLEKLGVNPLDTIQTNLFSSEMKESQNEKK